MFSSRTVLPITERFRTIAGVRRWSYRSWIILILTFSLLAGVSVVAARRVIVADQTHQSPAHRQPAMPAVPPPSYSHFVTPVNAAPFDVVDISSTPVTTVSAAGFDNVPIAAPESIVAAFGSNLATTTQVATTQPLPTELAGTSVEVNGRKAGLFFVSPGQINYLMPAATESGLANVVVKNGTNISNGTVQVARVAPAIFTANSSGRGVPAAQILRVFNNGLQRYEALSQFNASTGRYVTKAIDMGPASDLVFLVLFVTGVRQAVDDNGDGNFNENVRVLLGGEQYTPQFVGPQPQFVGLEQVNVLIPRSLIGRGVVNVSVVGLSQAASNVSNVVDLEIAGVGGNLPPFIGGFSGMVLAGDTFTINGTGFSPVKEENKVRISGRDAEVLSATSTQLQVMAPYGVETGTVEVTTTTGVGKSTQDLPVRTSISGVVENTARQPLEGATIRVCNPRPTDPNAECEPMPGLTKATSVDGAFVLPDAPEDALVVEVDGGSIQTIPPYPKITLKILTQRGRDNQFPRNISLQQSTGGSGTVGGGSFAGDSTTRQEAPLAPVTIQTGNFQLQFPDGVKVATPSGAKSATLVLTPLQNGRTPVALPYGYYSTSIVQITPFNVKIDPGAKLVFPNTDGFPANAPLALFRYDVGAGKFLLEKATVTVSADGQRIETEANAIKITSYYFASLLRSTTTITGRVLDFDRKPVQNAVARFRGQDALTDGTGSYVLRYVTAAERETITVEISSQSTGSRVDRGFTATAEAVVGGITTMPDIILPDKKSNRPPTIIVAPKLEIDEGKTIEIPIVVSDPDTGQTVTVSVSGATFVSVFKSLTSANANAYVLRLAPAFSQAGEYSVTITAIDNLGLSDRESVGVIVNKVNRAPVVTVSPLTLDEDTVAAVKIEVNDPDNDRLGYRLVKPPANGVLIGDLPTVSYKPNQNFNGTDQFTFVVNDGTVDSALATVDITVRPVNDAPILTVPEAQSLNKGQSLSFAVSAADVDAGQQLAITAVSLPQGATLTPVSPTSAQFRWTPALTQLGVFTAIFKVTDNGTPALSDTKEVRITVNDVSLISTSSAQVVNEGQLLSFDVLVTPGLGSPVSVTATEMPSGASISNPLAGTTRFSWTPGYTQAGVYTATFKATINSAIPFTETKQVQITVVDVVHDLSKESTPVTIFGAVGPLPVSLSDDGDFLGASLATGDLNGDNIPDIAIGAPGANGVGFDNGKVYVFFGRANWNGAIDLAQQKPDVEILGEAAEDHFGSSLAIGDVNGDGKNDLIIGAPMADGGTELPDAGKVYVVFGGLTGDTNDSITKLADVTITGSQRSEWAGTSVAAGFIHTKNGPAADLIIGAPGFDAPSTSAALSDVGAAYVFFGAPQLARNIELAKASANYKVTGTFANGLAGAKVAVGNFNGDEYEDFAIGAPSANSNGLKSSGAVFLALGGPAVSGEKNTSQASSLIFFGGNENDLLGSSLALGDINGDGRADLVIAASGGSGPNNSRPGAGNVYVIYGGTNLQGRPADLTIYGSSATGDTVPDALGTSLAIGDFNGDGIGDLLIGAPGADNTDPKRNPVGAVYLIHGTRGGLTGVYDLATKSADWTAWGADSGDNLGSGAIAVGNVNASEPADVILGIPKSYSVNNARGNAGEVRIVYGVRL